MPIDPGSHPRPPWWPEDEPWPPQRWGPPGWKRGPRHRGAWGRRGGMPPFGCAFLLVALVLGSVGILVLELLIEMVGLNGGGLAAAATPAGLIGLALGVVAVALTIRMVRAMTRPVSELAAAAARVEEGDYATRVEQPGRGPGELRTLVSTFNAMAERLEAEDATRRRLLADVSHELRTPLAVIQGNLEALLDGVYPPDAAHIGPILEETRVLERLIDDLRTLSLAESGALPLHREPTDAAVLLEDVAAAHRATAEAAKVSITVRAEPGLATIELDPMRMRQVVSNLVDNAVRAMPAGGSIELATARTADRLAITATDDGPGIPVDIRATVFERFTKSATSRGSGLGLSIARAIVLAHGGTIDAAAGPGGRGTAIRIELPLA
jgi:two-component system sensor histidine kinase BaeS